MGQAWDDALLAGAMTCIEAIQLAVDALQQCYDMDLDPTTWRHHSEVKFLPLTNFIELEVMYFLCKKGSTSPAPFA